MRARAPLDIIIKELVGSYANWSMNASELEMKNSNSFNPKST